MNSVHVGIFVGEAVEGSITVVTLVWLLVCVNVLVLTEVGLYRKALLAVATLVWLLVVRRVQVDDVVLQDHIGSGEEKKINIRFNIIKKGK